MIILPVFLFAYIFSQFYRSFLAVVTADLTRDLGVGPAELGNLSAIWFVVFSLAQFPVGYLLDRHGPRRTISAMMLAAVAGAVLFASARSFPVALAGMGLIGLGCAPILMGSLYYFGRNSGPEKFPIYTSIMVGIGNLGNLLGGRPLSQAVEAFGWRASLLAIAALTLLSAAMVAFFVRDPPRLEAPGRSGNALTELWEIVSYRPLWPIFLLNFASYGVVAAERGLWLGPYLQDVHGLEALARGNAAFLMALGMAIGAFVAGWMVPWFGSSKRVAIVGNLGTAAAFLGLGLIPGLGAPGAVALQVLAGLFGMCYGVILSHARLFFPEHLLGRGVTFANFLSIGGAGLVLSGSGYFMRGALADGISPTAAFSMLHVSFAAMLLTALVFYVRSPAGPEKR
ncbi:MAG TPA: MFS transporter [Beijerinckiaceae bacterium]|nr:MFS transporter [Beijerinckiaceae bacterium]